MSRLDAWLSAFLRESGFAERYPYYTYIIASLDVVEDPSVPWMGVSLHDSPLRGARYYLHVNVETLGRHPEYLRGLLLHEVHHVVLGHLAHPRFHGQSEGELMSLAQEMSANEYIEEALPTPITWQHFAEHGVRAGQSTMERYELLCAARAAGHSIEPKRGTAQVDEHGFDERAPSVEGLRATQEVIREAVKVVTRAESTPSEAPPKLAGREPGELIADLAEVEPSFRDWRESLAMFVARSRAPIHTWSRPSRRFRDRPFEVPGRAYSRRPSLRPTLLVAIDTSLSMSPRELSAVGRELQRVAVHANLIVAECDTRVTRTYPFRGALGEVQGRGGTDLRPVFLPAFLRRHRADGVVYFTDGEGPTPLEPPHVPVLWVLTKPSTFECPWGARARLDFT
jgi:predicted metal-dependent peptidase